MRVGPNSVDGRHASRVAAFLERDSICPARGLALPAFMLRGRGLRATRTTLSARGSLGAVPNARGGVMPGLLLDPAARRRSPATLPDFHAGRPPRNKGIRYPADPPTIEEIVTVMRRA